MWKIISWDVNLIKLEDLNCGKNIVNGKLWRELKSNLLEVQFGQLTKYMQEIKFQLNFDKVLEKRNEIKCNCTSLKRILRKQI